MIIKMCEHIDISQIRIEESQNVFAIITINGEKFAIQSCKNCHNDVKELEHVIISKEEFHTYLQKLS